MSLITKVVMLVSVIALSSCVKFTGDLNVKKHLTLYHEGSRGRLYKRILPPNSYPAILKIREDNQAVLTFDALDGRFVDTKMSLFDSGDIPTENGSFVIKADDSTQNYDIHATIKTKSKTSEMISGREKCTYLDDRYTCRPYCDYYGCRDYCGWETVTIRGHRKVEYQEVTSMRRLRVKLMGADSEELYATLKARSSKKKRHYSHTGFCRTRK